MVQNGCGEAMYWFDVSGNSVGSGADTGDIRLGDSTAGTTGIRCPFINAKDLCGAVG